MLYKSLTYLIKYYVSVSVLSAFVLSKLDYCNAILAGLPKVTIAPLQLVQYTVARMIACHAPHNRVRSTPRQLHWLPVQE